MGFEECGTTARNWGQVRGAESDQVTAGTYRAEASDQPPERAQPQVWPHSHICCCCRSAFLPTPLPWPRLGVSEKTGAGETDVDCWPNQLRTNQMPDKDGR
jgi:hypothetical protein